MIDSNIQDDGALFIKALQLKILELNRIDPNNLQSIINAIDKRDKELSDLREPPISMFNLMQTVVNNSGDPLGTFGKKQKKFILALAKSYPKPLVRNILINKLSIKGEMQSVRHANLRGLVRDIRKKLKVFGLFDLIKIIPSNSRKLPGYKLFLKTPVK